MDPMSLSPTAPVAEGQAKDEEERHSPHLSSESPDAPLPEGADTPAGPLPGPSDQLPPLASDSPTAFKGQKRTSRACESCRHKKVRCNGAQPCTACTIRGRDCVYTTLTVTGRPSKGSLKLLQRQIQHLERELAEARRHREESRSRGKQPNFASSMQLSTSFDSNLALKDVKQQKKPQNQSTQQQSFQQNSSSSYDYEKEDEGDFAFLRREPNLLLESIDPLTKSFQRNTLDLHTSFRLERHSEHDYTSNQGLIMMFMRLDANLNADKTSSQNLKLSKDDQHSMECANSIGTPNTALEAMCVPPPDMDLNWPSREREDRLVNVYFRLVHPDFPILCKESLATQRSGQLRTLMQSDPVWLSIMLGVFVAAARHLPSEKSNMNHWWNARIRLGAHQIAHTASIGGVQDCLLTALIRSSLFVRSHLDYVTIGVAIRALQDRGMHREAVLKSIKRDERYVDLIRCLWWTAQKLELILCCLYGRAPATSSFDTLPPNGSAFASHLSYFIASLKGLPILVQTLHKLYVRDPAARSRAFSEFDSWYKELKEFFAFSPDGKDDEKTLACAKLWLFANFALIMTYRPTISSVFRLLAMQSSNESGTKEYVQGQMKLYEEASAKFKDAMRINATILSTLGRRSERGIIFFDDAIQTHSAVVVSVSCFLVFTEAIQGRYCPQMMDDIETVCKVFEGPLFTSDRHKLASDYCRRLFETIKKRIGLYRGQSHSEGEGNSAQLDPSIVSTQLQAQAPRSSQSQSSVTIQAPPSTYSEQEAAVFNSVGACTFNQQPFGEVGHVSPTSTSTRCTVASSLAADNSPSQSQGSPFTESSPAVPKVFMTSTQYNNASPQSRLWENFLYNEMMFMDAYDHPMLDVSNRTATSVVPSVEDAATCGDGQAISTDCGTSLRVPQQTFGSTNPLSWPEQANPLLVQQNLPVPMMENSMPLLYTPWLGPDLSQTPLPLPLPTNDPSPQGTNVDQIRQQQPQLQQQHYFANVPPQGAGPISSASETPGGQTTQSFDANAAMFGATGQYQSPQNPFRWS